MSVVRREKSANALSKKILKDFVQKFFFKSTSFSLAQGYLSALQDVLRTSEGGIALN